MAGEHGHSQKAQQAPPARSSVGWAAPPCPAIVGSLSEGATQELPWGAECGTQGHRAAQR